ncbi:MAG: hypothetical protein QOD51_2907 [Candidatus Eremiobacteraeota bacterium]|jgi:hypothetical protein|nr:hypothetical protein [Candidatus Eremiobacteraeota bacterium]
MADYWSLVEPVWEEISVYDGPARYLEGIHAVPEPVGLLFASHWTYQETFNGGFSQFFHNSTGIVAPEALRGFRAIHQVGVANVLERAMLHFGRIYPRDRAERQRLMSVRTGTMDYCVDPALSTFDDEFFALIDEEAGGFQAAANRFAAALNQ